ncbi:MAG: glutaminyl-peptide cyclotransferase [Planctomycetota bacterium]
MNRAGKAQGAVAKAKSRRVVLVIVAVVVLAPLLVVLTRWPTGSAALPTGDCGFEIVKTFPHDPQAFTQGLIFHDGFLYETTGQHGHSRLRKVVLETGKVVQEHRLDNDLFGEGMTLFGDRIYHLTWRSGTGFVYDAKTFKEVQRFRYSGEGWGLTNDNKRLYMSNGTSRLIFLDPKTLQSTGSVIVMYRDPVTGRDTPLHALNELEYVGGEILANVWRRDVIARIDPESGRVRGWIDLTALKSKGGITSGEVLNGIAYDKNNDRLFVTGKWWPKLFQIKLVPKG